MKELKEVVVFTDGDSSKLSTWSNVPFFFTESLIAKGIKVTRIDISPSRSLEKVFYKTVYRVLSKLNKATSFTYSRSLIHFIDTRAKIKKAIEQNSEADAYIFITFSFSAAGLTGKPIIQFCDWTYDYEFRYFLSREPDYFERQAIKREDSQILGTDLVFALFPSVAEYMQKRYSAKKIAYVGNVINSVYKVSERDIEEKANSNNLLFVGSIKYIEGAKSLIAAFEQLKKERPLLKLDIIGIENVSFSQLPDGVTCHGYLDKGDDEQRKLYYDIFKKAKVFINTNPKWSAFSASIEAMYFYTPVIVTPYNEFLNTFGDDIKFGSYCEENTEALIKEKILDILQSSDYKSLCLSAHDAVKEFTWDAYMGRIVKDIEEYIEKKPTL